jgi:REP element-mobilizing transposase RayT
MNREYQRRSIRLKGYDYSQSGTYFVTICTQNRESLFGESREGEMRLNDAGRMVQSVWNELPVFYSGVVTDEFIVMPNHIHGIVILSIPSPVGATPRGRPADDARQSDEPQNAQQNGQSQGQSDWGQNGQPQGVAPTGDGGDFVPMETVALSLSDVVHRFKTLTTKRYIDGVKQGDWQPFVGRVWQRNYYEHIIRNEKSLNRIRQYIANNPAQWETDDENPHRQRNGGIRNSLEENTLELP